ncbi:MAG: exosortase B [Paucibacter sp.]|nr:exosortase B [Roseateles sp.]
MLTRKPANIWPEALDLPAALMVLAGLLGLYGPRYVELAQSVWRSDEQGHGPIILAVSLWLLYSARHKLVDLQGRAAPVTGFALLLCGGVLYVLGYALDIWIFQIGSQVPVLAALVLIWRGWRGLRLVWFALFFLCFMVPLPEALVAAVTAPLKLAVSAVAGSLLYHAGYPIGRSGVMLTVGPYQLMVADACAGLNSMFTLEALGMLYMNLMHYTSVSRNLLLALALVPTAFVANVCRVMILVLVTYYFGDEAGQGFVHGFAGMVLFMVALMLMLVYDRILGFFYDKPRGVAS